EVAREQLAVVVERDVSVRVAGDVDDVERDARNGDLVAARDRVRRIMSTDVEAAARRAVAQYVGLLGRSPHLGARPDSERCDAADVVDVRMRHENAARRGTETCEFES